MILVLGWTVSDGQKSLLVASARLSFVVPFSRLFDQTLKVSGDDHSYDDPDHRDTFRLGNLGCAKSGPKTSERRVRIQHLGGFEPEDIL